MPCWAEMVRFEVWQVLPDADPEPESEEPEPPLVLPLLEPPLEPLPEEPSWPAAALGDDVAPEALDDDVAPEALDDDVVPEALDDDVVPEALESLGPQAVRDSPAATTTRARTESLLLLRIASP
jgi:hypothetical protein